MNKQESFSSFFKNYDCLTITGPTGVGKTGLALLLAQVWPIEVISMDSALVYKGMDIGTAKPTSQELASVPHHLINIRTPLEAYNAAEFAQDAHSLILEIRSRGKLPVIVGGTLLYFKALFEGLNDLPKTDPVVREQINKEAEQLGWPALHAQLTRVDPVTAKRLPPTDAQRVSRALEVWRISGRALSTYFVEKPKTVLRNKLISLEPSNRAWLHKRLELRFHQMLDDGLMDEVKKLKQTLHLNSDLPSMRCVGYRQVWELFESAGADDSFSVDRLKEMTDKGVAATRQLAKRQLTWLRSTNDKEVIVCDIEDGRMLGSDLFKILKIQS